MDKNEYKLEKAKKSLEKLMLVSKMASNILNSGIIRVVEVIGYDVNPYQKNFTFHPNGNCGCIKLDDDYFLDIRCDHLMWAEGWCEMDDELLNLWDNQMNVIFIYGNHKGTFKAQVIF